VVLHLLYLRKTKELYAFSYSKDIVAEFLSQRNPKCFKYKKVKAYTNSEELKLKAIVLQEHEKMLGKFPYEHENGYVMLAATYKEENDVTRVVEAIERDYDEIYNMFNKYRLKNKYAKIIKRFIECYAIEKNKNNKKEKVLYLNTLGILLDFHSDTLIYRKEEDN